MNLDEGGESVGNLLRQILAEATALKHVGTKTTNPYAKAIIEKAEQAIIALDCCRESRESR